MNAIAEKNPKWSIIKGLISSLLPFTLLYFYFTAIKVLCVDSLRFNSTSLYIYLIYTAMISYIIINYVRTMNDNKVTTFDRFPFTYHDISRDKRIEVSMAVKEQVIDKQVKDKIVCEYCLVYKPPRSAHCKECGRCFLKRVSHCYFLETCIGFHNQKFFVLLLASLIVHGMAVIIAFIIALKTTPLYKMVAVRKNQEYTLVFEAHFIISIVIAFIEVLICTCYLVFHLYLIFRNETNLERKALNLYKMNDDALDYVFTQGLVTLNTPDLNRDTANPYFLGYYKNVREVFGDGKWEWALPTYTMKGNGTEFELNCAKEELKAKTLVPVIPEHVI
ncbi:putative DHHC-type Zn-finger protein [Trachipleistophora hominis]|uniref:Palmitoyltransferase n=1 Tax=Trachipleistophora hominis TaxID=72359 RepID=L7JSV5_TRAHO|nr:putative DHHC-type Zn-finger protein [Trachipleistophora hominis]